ncbi:DUF6414 family protein [Saliterribacillus persicus]|uniref:Uncharacterized protein n=1 Tax=Saliterribacillus persicus TaxID=930114 RepID=A0A368XTZ9_9BACI|nr:hypothetical protein [Saliterribacillus persicus]RCW70626.1 hypothetical protein DFR57_10623 [Saliterribacillus persicus]
MFLPTIYWQDGKRTKQFLEMLVEDLMTEYNITQSNGQTKNLEVGGNAEKVLAKYRKGSENNHQVEGTVSKSDSALFKDLYTILDDKDMIQKLIGFDEEIWDQLKSGEFIELSGEFNQSPAELVLSSMMDMVDQYKGFFEDSTNKEDIDLASSLLKFKKATVIIHPYIDSNEDYKFFTSLDTDGFVEDRYDLEGEFIILAKIKKIFKPHQKIDLIKLLPGKLKVNRKQLLTFIPQLSDSDDITFDVENIDEESFEIKGPVIELTPIAIYQE